MKLRKVAQGISGTQDPLYFHPVTAQHKEVTHGYGGEDREF